MARRGRSCDQPTPFDIHTPSHAPRAAIEHTPVSRPIETVTRIIREGKVVGWGYDDGRVVNKDQHRAGR